jgi:hypothetical protein
MVFSKTTCDPGGNGYGKRDRVTNVFTALAEPVAHGSTNGHWSHRLDRQLMFGKAGFDFGAGED